MRQYFRQMHKPIALLQQPDVDERSVDHALTEAIKTLPLFGPPGDHAPGDNSRAASPGDSTSATPEPDPDRSRPRQPALKVGSPVLSDAVANRGPRSAHAALAQAGVTARLGEFVTESAPLGRTRG